MSSGSIDFQASQAIAGRQINGLTDPQSLKQLGQIEDKKVQAEAVAKQLESVFYGMMIKAMRQTVPDGGIDGKGLGRSAYVQILDQQYSQLSGLPRDPRFHDALVRQIMSDPKTASLALDQMKQHTAAHPEAETALEIQPFGEAHASKF